jgi:transcriptional regulator with XRE-family HTH domain
MPAQVDGDYARQIGHAIAAARRERRMTQDELRRRLGNSKNAVSNWERGVSAPTVQSIRELCRVLRVTPERLLAVSAVADPGRRSQATDAEALASRLAALRRSAESAAPNLLRALREAEDEARRLGELLG